ncbi:protein SPT2 homolog [Mustelus asterias]
MDFSSVLNKASENRVDAQATKRYSLSVKPLKKQTQVKGVQSAAVQAFLKRKEEEVKNKDLEDRRKKAELIAKRVALKHDRKARAMATRTKDNFRGYDGVPVEQKSKKKTSDDEEKDQRMDDSNDEDYYNVGAQAEDEMSEVEDSDEFGEDWDERQQYTEPEIPVKRLKRQHREPEIPSKEPKRQHREPEVSTEEPEQFCREVKKPKVPKKPPSAPMNFSELLKLAEKKQFEPVALKPVKKVEEKLYTAEELKEMEFLERKRQKHNDKRKSEKEVTFSHPASSSRKESSTKDSKSTKLVRDSGDKLVSSREGSSVHGINKKPKNEKPPSSVSYKAPAQEKSRSSGGVGHSVPKTSSNNGGKTVLNSSNKSGTDSQTPSKGLKPGSNGTHSALSSKNSQKRLDQSTSSKKIDSSSTRHERTGGSNPSHSKNVSSSAPERSKSSSGLNQKHKSSSGNSDQPRSSNLGQQRSKGLVSSGNSRPSSAGGICSTHPKVASNSGPPKHKNASSSGSVQSKSRSASGSVRPAGSGSVRPAGSGSVRPAGSGSVRPAGSGSVRPAGSGSVRPAGSGSVRPAGSGSVRPAGSGSVRPAGSGSVRPAGSGSVRPAGSGSVRPAGSGSVRPGNSSVPGQPGSGVGVPKPKCTVVAETISSKNFPSRPSNGQMSNMRSAPPGYRPMARPPVTAARSPISYGRRPVGYDEESDYDSEMDDFIDDAGESQDEISKHIKDIFGYDRRKYRDESDYALRYMESSWKEQQKEEAKSLHLGIMEDAEELRKEEEELKRKKLKVKKQQL